MKNATKKAVKKAPAKKKAAAKKKKKGPLPLREKQLQIKKQPQPWATGADSFRSD